MKKKIVILVSLFILLVVLFAPVKLVKNYLPKNSDIDIGGMQGSIWSGKIDHIGIKGWFLNDIDYELSFFSLLTAQVGGSAEIHKGDITGDFSFQISNQTNAQIEAANLQLSAMQLEKYIPFPGVELGGTFTSKDFDLLVTNNKPESISGLTSWNNASVSVKNRNWKLGGFEILWHTAADGDLIVGTFNKTNNALKLDGVITISKTGMLEYKGSISTETEQGIYTAFLFFADGKAKNSRLPVKFKKKIF